MSQYKLVTYQSPQGARAGFLLGETIFRHCGGDRPPGLRRRCSTCCATGTPRAASLRDAAATATAQEPTAGRCSATRLLAPVTSPGGIFCAGANFTDHMMEMAKVQNLTPEPDPHSLGLKPWHFIKASHCLAPPDSTVQLPRLLEDGRLGGRVDGGDRPAARNVSIENALDHVAGYTVANDLSARDFTKRPHVPDNSPFKYDWLSQKCFEGACPLGPWIVPADAIPDPQNVGIKLWVNDVIKQDSHTSKMIFTLAEQIAHLSTRVTLAAGRPDPDRNAGGRRPRAQGIPAGRRRGEGVGRGRRHADQHLRVAYFGWLGPLSAVIIRVSG